MSRHFLPLRCYNRLGLQGSGKRFRVVTAAEEVATPVWCRSTVEAPSSERRTSSTEGAQTTLILGRELPGAQHLPDRSPSPTAFLGQTLHERRKPPRSPMVVVATLNIVSPVACELFGKSIRGQARTNPESRAAKNAIVGKTTRTIRNFRINFPESDIACYTSWIETKTPRVSLSLNHTSDPLRRRLIAMLLVTSPGFPKTRWSHPPRRRLAQRSAVSPLGHSYKQPSGPMSPVISRHGGRDLPSLPRRQADRYPRSRSMSSAQV